MNEIMMAVAAVLEAVAWPVVALVVGLMFKDELKALLGRIRKGAGIEFDPPAQAAGQGTITQEAAQATALIGSMRTGFVAELEGVLGTTPPLTQLPSGPEREQALLTMAARAVVFWLFEQVDGTMWASQLQILAHLNARPQESVDSIKESFFEPAVRSNPEWFAGYNFESYLGFLSSHSLITITAENQVSITLKGQDYLSWRIQQRKPLKLHG